MRTEPVQPRAWAAAGTGLARLVSAGIAAMMACLFALSACSSAEPSLEPTGAGDVGSSDDGSPSAVPEPDDAAEEATPDGTADATAATPDPSAGDPVLVGVLLDTTNLMATTDRQPGVAFVESIERIAAEGGLLGRPVEVRWVNTTSRMSVVDAAAAELIEAGADLLVVTCELDFARPAIDRAGEAGVVVISPCGPEAAWGSGELGPLAFSMMPTAEALGAVMAEHAWAEGHRAVTVVADETAPEPRAECRGFLERWETLGGRVRSELAVNLISAEGVVTGTSGPDPLQSDALVLCSFARVADAVIAAVRGQALRLPIIAGPSLDTGAWVPEDVDAPLRDFTMLTLASTAGDDPADAVIAAAAEFLVADGVPPNNGRFVLGADLAEAFGIAVTRAGTTDGVAVADALRVMVDEPLVSGAVTFGGRQAPTTWPLRIMRNDGGVFVNDGVVADPSTQ